MKIVYIWFSFLLVLREPQQKQVKQNIFKCSLYFLGKERLSVLTFKKLALIMKWASVGLQNVDSAVGALGAVVCVCIKATGLILQTFSVFFSKIISQGCYLSCFQSFLCIATSNYSQSSIHLWTREAELLPLCVFHPPTALLPWLLLINWVQ